jgi:Na+-driven multidrug efflux pump
LYWIIGIIGTAELAAANVLVTVLLFAILPGLAMGIACTTLVGQALGRKEPEDAYQWAWDVAKVPDLVSSIFIHDPVTRELARWPMRLVGLTMPIEAMGFAFMHALLGAGDARRVMMVSAGSQWLLFLPLAYLFGPVLGFGLFTIWLIQGGSRTLSTVFFVLMWRGRHWQRIVL